MQAIGLRPNGDANKRNKLTNAYFLRCKICCWKASLQKCLEACAHFAHCAHFADERYARDSALARTGQTTKLFLTGIIAFILDIYILAAGTST